MVTKEDVEKAKAIWVEADAAAKAEAVADAAWAAWAAVEAAYDKYIKLKEEYENGN